MSANSTTSSSAAAPCRSASWKQTSTAGLRSSDSSEFQSRVPVAPRGARAELLFDDRVREFRRADAVGIDDVRVPAVGTDNLRSDDRRLQRFDLLLVRRILQKHDQEVARIALRFLEKRIACHSLF